MAGTEQEKVAAFRWARDELRDWLGGWLEEQQAPRRMSRQRQALGIALFVLAVAAVVWPTLGVAAAAAVIVAGALGGMFLGAVELVTSGGACIVRTVGGEIVSGRSAEAAA